MNILPESDGVDIPDFVPMDGWKQIPIKESMQPLINLSNLDPQIQIEPRYYLNGIPNALFEMYLRQDAAERLIQAARFLPDHYSLVIFDAYRPMAIQASLFNSFKEHLRDQYPQKGEEELDSLTQTYVSIPSSDPVKPSPHATGGAVDLSIVDPDGQLLDMGTEFDSFDILARTAYFKGSISDVHKNRLLLYQAMHRAGFSNYPEEWWHYDFGNQFWGKITGETAIYGLADMANLNGHDLDPLPDDAEMVVYRLRADGSENRFLRMGLAGYSENIRLAIETLSELKSASFMMKQQLAGIILRKYGVYRIAF